MNPFDKNMVLQLKENGYYHVPDLFKNEDILPLNKQTNQLINQWYGGQIENADFWNYTNKKGNKILYRIQNFENHCPLVKELILKPKYKQLLSSVFDHDARPNCFALIIKMPDCNGVPWHRDIDKIPPHQLYNFSIFIDNALPENGCLEVIPKTHLDFNDYSKITSGPENTTKLVVSANDVIIHDVRLFHGSGPSVSNSIRRSIVIEFGSN
jgi:ectoine hydroxylase-related dioxygenase (phytanoyl-CoA dioxygenase family)